MPKHNVLLHLLVDMSSSWHDIGVALRLSQNYLNGLSHNQDTLTTKPSNVVRNWMDSQSSPVNPLTTRVNGRINYCKATIV